MTAIVTTCGTSLLTHGADKEMRELITACANHSESDLEPDAKEALDACLTGCREALADAEIATVRKRSAELNGLLAWYGDGWPERGHQEVHYLLHTDTYLGAQAAGLVADWMCRQGLAVHAINTKGLNTAHAESFEAAMSDLARWCYDTFDSGAYGRVIFNLVGGFKSLQGFMQAIGMFYADECIYIFEAGAALLRIPRLPIRLDARGTFVERARTFMRLEVWGQAKADQCQGIPETLLLSVGDDRSLSSWGQLLWDKSKGAVLGGQILDPLSDRLRWGPGFGRQAEALQPDLRVRLNRQLARLARCIEEGGEAGGYNPRSLDFQQLCGTQRGPTHECDAFGGTDPRRLFGHFDEGVFVVDRLGMGLGH